MHISVVSLEWAQVPPSDDACSPQLSELHILLHAFLSLLLAFTNAAASANIIFWVCFPDSLVSFAHFSYKADFNIVSAWPFEFYFMFPFLWFYGHPIMTVAKFYNLLDFWQWNCGSHVYSIKLFSYTKRWNPIIWVNMEEPGNYYFVYRKTSTTWSQA